MGIDPADNFDFSPAVLRAIYVEIVERLAWEYPYDPATVDELDDLALRFGLPSPRYHPVYTVAWATCELERVALLPPSPE